MLPENTLKRLFVSAKIQHGKAVVIPMTVCVHATGSEPLRIHVSSGSNGFSRNPGKILQGQLGLKPNLSLMASAANSQAFINGQNS